MRTICASPIATAGAVKPVLPAWTEPADIPRELGATTLALGQFDGVHRGHQQLLERARRAADLQGISAGVVTFARHTSAVLAPEREPAQLTPLGVKLELLQEHGMDFAVVLPVTPDVLRKPALRFVSVLLLNALDARTIVVGPDYRFGHRALGNPDLLAELTRDTGIDVVVMDELTDADKRISSTRIRNAITTGRVGEAAQLLGRDHRIAATVSSACAGNSALVELEPFVARPAQGSYSVLLRTPNRTAPSPGAARLTLDADGRRAVITRAAGLHTGDDLVIELRSELNPSATSGRGR